MPPKRVAVGTVVPNGGVVQTWDAERKKYPVLFTDGELVFFSPAELKELLPECSSVSHIDADSLIGEKVRKKFASGDFLGEVISFDCKTQWFKVKYVDSDEEEMTYPDLRKILVNRKQAASNSVSSVQLGSQAALALVGKRNRECLATPNSQSTAHREASPTAQACTGEPTASSSKRVRADPVPVQAQLQHCLSLATQASHSTDSGAQPHQAWELQTGTQRSVQRNLTTSVIEAPRPPRPISLVATGTPEPPVQQPDNAGRARSPLAAVLALKRQVLHFKPSIASSQDATATHDANPGASNTLGIPCSPKPGVVAQQGQQTGLVCTQQSAASPKPQLPAAVCAGIQEPHNQVQPAFIRNANKLDDICASLSHPSQLANRTEAQLHPNTSSLPMPVTSRPPPGPSGSTSCARSLQLPSLATQMNPVTQATASHYTAAVSPLMDPTNSRPASARHTSAQAPTTTHPTSPLTLLAATAGPLPQLLPASITGAADFRAPLTTQPTAHLASQQSLYQPAQPVFTSAADSSRNPTSMASAQPNLPATQQLQWHPNPAPLGLASPKLAAVPGRALALQQLAPVAHNSAAGLRSDPKGPVSILPAYPVLHQAAAPIKPEPAPGLPAFTPSQPALPIAPFSVFTPDFAWLAETLSNVDAFWQPLKVLLWESGTRATPVSGSYNQLQGFQRKFELSEQEAATLRKPAAGTPQHGVIVISVMKGDPQPYRCHWYAGTSVYFNSHEIPDVCGKKRVSTQLPENGTDKVLNLSRCCRPGSNSFFVSWPLADSQKENVVVVMLAARRSKADVKAMMTPPVSVTQGVKDIQETVFGQDEVLTDSYTLSLRCPLSLARIVTPAYMKNVSVTELFDLDAFLDVAEQTGKWSCPSNKRLSSVKELQVSSFVKAVLDVLDASKCKDITEIDINSEGKWRPKGKPAAWMDVLATGPVSLRSTASNTVESHAIDLTGDDAVSNDSNSVIVID